MKDTDIEMPVGVVHKLVLPTNKVLHEPTELFDFANPPIDPMQLFQDLKATLVEVGGLGLSANQIGIPYAAFVYGNSKEPNMISGVFNPKIVDAVIPYTEEEGCLSYPNVLLKVERFKNIRVRYTTWNGVTDTVKLSGLTARVFQHEIDHLNGLTFGQKLSKFNLRRGLEKANKKYGMHYVVSDFY